MTVTEPYRSPAGQSTAHRLSPRRELCFIGGAPDLFSLVTFVALVLVAGAAAIAVDSDLRNSLITFGAYPLALVLGAMLIHGEQTARVLCIGPYDVTLRGSGGLEHARVTAVEARGPRVVLTTTTLEVSLSLSNLRFWDRNARAVRARRIAKDAASFVHTGVAGEPAEAEERSHTTPKPPSWTDLAIPGSPRGWVLGISAATLWLLYLFLTRNASTTFWLLPGMCGPVLFEVCDGQRAPALTALWVTAGGFMFFGLLAVGTSSLGRPVDTTDRGLLRMVLLETAAPFQKDPAPFRSESHRFLFLWLPRLLGLLFVSHFLIVIFIGLILVPLTSFVMLALASIVGVLQTVRLVSGARLLSIGDGDVRLRIDGEWLQVTECRARGLWLELRAGGAPIWCRFPSVFKPVDYRKSDWEQVVAGVAAYIQHRQGQPPTDTAAEANEDEDLRDNVGGSS